MTNLTLVPRPENKASLTCLLENGEGLQMLMEITSLCAETQVHQVLLRGILMACEET